MPTPFQHPLGPRHSAVLLILFLVACAGSTPAPEPPGQPAAAEPSRETEGVTDASSAVERSSLGQRPWKFVSIPDFLNFDIAFPEPGWDAALDYVLAAIAAEEPEFVLVPGDLVMGHWHLDDLGVEHWAQTYYSAWKERMESHGLRYYTALGDHEIGDNYWRPQQEGHKLALVPEYKRAFRDHMDMPRNGPAGLEGTAFWWLHGNVLFVSLDVFDPDPARGIAIRPGAEQLRWLDDLMARHPDVDHRIVMGHAPILGPVWKRSSSALFVEGGDASPLWQALAHHRVDLYLCGEVHAITCIERDGVEQISHGSLFGFFNPVNYLVVTVTPERMTLELKEIDTRSSGGRLWQTGDIRPRQNLHIRREARKDGFRTVGSMIVEKSGGDKRFLHKTGVFDEASNPPPGSRRAVRLPKSQPTSSRPQQP